MGVRWESAFNGIILSLPARLLYSQKGTQELLGFFLFVFLESTAVEFYCGGGGKTARCSNIYSGSVCNHLAAVYHKTCGRFFAMRFVFLLLFFADSRKISTFFFLSFFR